MTFGEVVTGLKAGQFYTRSGWPAENTFVFSIADNVFKVAPKPHLAMRGYANMLEGHEKLGHLAAQSHALPWLAEPADMLAEDWQEVRV